MVEIGDSRQQILHSTPETLDNRRTQTVDSRFEALDSRKKNLDNKLYTVDLRL